MSSQVGIGLAFWATRGCTGLCAAGMDVLSFWIGLSTAGTDFCNGSSGISLRLSMTCCMFELGDWLFSVMAAVLLALTFGFSVVAYVLLVLTF